MSESFGVPYRFNGKFTSMLQHVTIIPLHVRGHLCAAWSLTMNSDVVSSQVPQAAMLTTSGLLRASHVEDRFPEGLQLFWHPLLLCLPLLPCIRIFEGHPSLPGTDTVVPAPFQATVVQTPSLSWLRLHLSTPPLGVFLLATISLPRVTSELAALIPLCVRQASFGVLACALETHEQGILQCVVVHDFDNFSSVSTSLGGHA